MIQRAMVARGDMHRGTPWALYRWLDRCAGGFTVDVCATPALAKHERFYTPRDDGLAQSWRDEVAFCNPPYGARIVDWAKKCRDEALRGKRTQAWQVLPSRMETRWWSQYVLSSDGAAGPLQLTRYVPETRMLWLRWSRLLTGVFVYPHRVQFLSADGKHTQGPNGAPFATVIVVHACARARPQPQLLPGDIDLTRGWP